MTRVLSSRGAMVALVLALGLVPLGLLAYFATDTAGDALNERVEENLEAVASMSALYIDEELRGLAEVGQAFANRPVLVEALSRSPVYNRPEIGRTLEELAQVRAGIGTAFVADPEGVLIDIVPKTRAIVGKDFSFRDWYKGVTASGEPYVSEAYRTQATGQPLVVAVAAPVWAGGAAGGERVGILVVAYRIETIQRFAERFARARGVSLTVTDQRGVVIADPGAAPSRLVHDRDEQVAAALAGNTGVTKTAHEGEEVISAYAPLRTTGWTVRAATPTSVALESVRDVRWAVTATSALLAGLIVAGAWFLARALRQRQRADDLMKAVLDSTRDGIAFIEPDGSMALTNAALDRMSADFLRIPTNGAVQDAAASVAARTTDPEGFLAEVGKWADPEYVGVAEYQMLSGEAIRRYTAPVRDSGGSVLGRISVVSQITAEREAERLKNELMATVSHELRTPLASILGFAELLVTRELDEETRTRYLGTIHREAGRLTALINDFLDLQRMEEGGFKLALEPFELGQLVRHEAEVFSGQSAEHTMQVDVPDQELEVVGEPERIAQVLANLLSNAIKYSPAGGTVRLAMGMSGSFVRVSVSDEGLGIPRDQQRHIFTKFFRVDSSDTRRIGGTGLGLALCREIIEAHGGRMGFESNEGRGSTFWFELPASGAVRGDGKPRLLVIEDNAEAAALLERHLGQDGYVVEIAASGEEGLRRVRGGTPPALICLDIRLAGEVDGWGVLAQLKAAADTAGIPVLVCTAYGGRRNAAVLGAADFLAKPFSAQQLRETVGRLLPAGGRTVLVVDDEEPVRRLVIETLGGVGLELREAVDGQEALVEVAERPPDVIVLDLVMPKMDGFAVLEHLQEAPETRSIPVVVLTARQLSPAERTWLRTRALAVLEKSDYSAQELRKLVVKTVGS